MNMITLFACVFVSVGCLVGNDRVVNGQKCMRSFSTCECTREREILCTRENSLDYQLPYLANSVKLGRAVVITFSYLIDFRYLEFLCESRFSGEVLGVKGRACRQLNECGVNCEAGEIVSKKQDEFFNEKTNDRARASVEDDRDRVEGDRASMEEDRASVERDRMNVEGESESDKWVFGLISFVLWIALVGGFCVGCGWYLRGWNYVVNNIQRRINNWVS